MGDCRAELCRYWTGQGCICAVIDLENTVVGEDDDGYYRQSTTACCPRETIPDSCSCLDDCDCMCLDCACEAWGDDDA